MLPHILRYTNHTPEINFGAYKNLIKILMSLLTIAEIVFFLVYGISHFAPFKYSQTICAIAAIVIGAVLLLGKI